MYAKEHSLPTNPVDWITHHHTNFAIPFSHARVCVCVCVNVDKVRVAWHKLTGQRVAVKTYEKAKIKVRSEIPVVAREEKSSLEGVA